MGEIVELTATALLAIVIFYLNYRYSHPNRSR